MHICNVVVLTKIDSKFLFANWGYKSNVPGYCLSNKCHSPVVKWEVLVFFADLFKFVDEQDFCNRNHQAIFKLVTPSFSSLCLIFQSSNFLTNLVCYLSPNSLMDITFLTCSSEIHLEWKIVTQFELGGNCNNKGSPITCCWNLFRRDIWNC